MHPNVNYSIKLLRDVGKKIARYFDDSSQHVAQSSTDLYQSAFSFLEGINEKIIFDLERTYKDHLIMEASTLTSLKLQQLGRQQVWVYQPVCGYENFVRSIPLFCMTLTCFIDGQAEHAIVYNPLTDEVFHASRGMGAQLAGRRLRLQTKKNQNLLMYTNDLQINSLSFQKQVRFLGSPNLELVYIAANRGDITCHTLSDQLSISAGKLIAREAGALCFTHKTIDSTDSIYLHGHTDHLKKVMEELTMGSQTV
jgi:myo-inositol-1(or 4)-monophosphatase